jgi:hypothetical protein
MSEKYLVCHGATCKCKFGSAPDKLTIKTQKKTFINDSGGSNKLMATDKDIGSSTFEKNTFGPCKQQPLPGGSYKPCQIIVAKWSNFYEKITLEENKGKALLENSKATCPIGGPDCIEITLHGQKAEPGKQEAKQADPDAIKAINPATSMQELQEDMDEEEVKYAE